MTKTEKAVQQAANVAYEKYAELQEKIGREEAAKISFEVLKREMAKCNE